MIMFDLESILNGSKIYDSYEDFIQNVNIDDDGLILFHGGPEEVSDPDAAHPRANKYADFGIGFYLTTLHLQAEGWAHQSASSSGVVSVFLYRKDLDERFFGWDYTEEWLEFIKECRNNGRQYDEGEVIIGRVADDRIWKPVVNHPGMNSRAC